VISVSGLVAQFFGEGNDLVLEELPANLREVIDPWANRAERADGGIAFLPRSSGGRLWWYGFAPDPRARRELLGLLDAWIGPTSSDLVRSRGRLDQSDGFDARLSEVRPGTVLRFEVLPRTGSTSKDAKLDVRHALRRMVRLLDERPPSEFQAARSPAEVLEDLGHALAAGEHGLALALLDELRSSGDLDETNLAFLRMRVLAGLRLWQEVLSDPVLPEVLSMRRPPGVSRAVQQAVYGAHLELLDREERDEDLLAAFAQVQDEYAGVERGSPPPRSRGELVVQFLYALSAEPGIREGIVHRLLGAADVMTVGLRQRLGRLQATAEPAARVTLPEVDPLTEATNRFFAGDAVGALDAVVGIQPSLAAVRLAVLAAADIGTPEAARKAGALLDRDPAFRDQVVASGALGRDSVEKVESLNAPGRPDSWASWFTRLAGGASRDEAVAWAREGADEWPRLEEADALARLVDSTDAVLGVLGEVAGQFLSVHGDLLDGPARTSLAERLIAALAESGRTSPGVQAQALNLADILLSSEPTGEQITTALEWLGLLRAPMAAAATIDWQVDLLQTVTYYPVPDEATTARLDYINASLADLRRFRTALDRTALESIANACASVDMPLPTDFEHLLSGGTTTEEDVYGCLADRRVVLYSLMESASRRAADTLRRLVPSVDVVTTADHVGSDRLAELSKNADVFVMVTAAAKHSATGFIESHRKPKTLIHVNAKGSSALLRCLARLCDNSSRDS
jgi:hypothetical protein